jgi:hypothetical protein
VDVNVTKGDKWALPAELDHIVDERSSDVGRGRVGMSHNVKDVDGHVG